MFGQNIQKLTRVCPCLDITRSHGLVENRSNVSEQHLRRLCGPRLIHIVPNHNLVLHTNAVNIYHSNIIYVLVKCKDSQSVISTHDRQSSISVSSAQGFYDKIDKQTRIGTTTLFQIVNLLWASNHLMFDSMFLNYMERFLLFLKCRNCIFDCQTPHTRLTTVGKLYCAYFGIIAHTISQNVRNRSEF